MEQLIQAMMIGTVMGLHIKQLDVFYRKWYKLMYYVQQSS